MKSNILLKSAIALVVSSTAIPALAYDTTVYGRFRAGALCVDTGATNDDCQLVNRSSRFGFKISNDLGNGMTAFGRYEFEVKLDDGQLRGDNDDSARRLSYVGIKGDLGELSIGARWSPFYNHITSPVDGSQLVGATWQDVGYISSPFRESNTVNYKHSAGNFKFGVQVVMDSDAEGDQLDEIHFGGTIDAGAVSIGLGVMSAADEGTANGETLLGVNVSGKAGIVDLSGSFFTADEADIDALLLQATFGLSNDQSITAHFGMDMPGADGAPEPTVISAEYAKKFNKQFRWFAGADIVDHDTTADNTTRFGAGVRLEF